MDAARRDTNSKVVICAMAAHEVNRVYCTALGDHSQPRWEDAPDWQVHSLILGVGGVLAGNGPEQSHESWLAEKEREGWKYGPVKDPDKREHPCFLPYDQLSEAQRQKDRLFVTTVRCMAAALGMVVHYPARPASPALPAGAIDWSQR